MPPANGPVRRKIDARLTSRSLEPKVLPALQVLGYALRDESDSIASKSTDSAIWLVDQARLGELPNEEAAPDAQILLISSTRQNPEQDPRILSQTARPAGLRAVYSMIQSAFEHTPRKTPRVRTQLSARCIRASRRSVGAVFSLSEGGCLLRTAERLRTGSRMDLQFVLPEYGLVSTKAQCRYVRKGDAGLEFSQPAFDIRDSIAHYVTMRLAETFENGGIGGLAGSHPA